MSAPALVLSRALSPAVADKVRTLVRDLDAAAGRAEAAAREAEGNVVTRAWQAALGTSNVRADLRSAAAAARRLAQAAAARAPTLRTDAEALAWYAMTRGDSGGVLDTRALDDAARMVTPTAAAVDVAKASAKDLGSLTVTLGKWLPYVVLVVLLVYADALRRRLRG